MDDQARHIYKKVESESIVNVEMIEKETEANKLGRNVDEDKVSPYHEIITNKENIITSQIEQRSILQ